MSWAAHDLEPYVIQKHLGRKIAFMPLLAGSYAPDMLTKWFVYGVGIFGHEIKASDPARFHRGWPGFGFTHSLVFGVVISMVIYGVWRKPVIAYSFLIGQWAHALTDTGDTVGTMLFFPFTTHLFAIGAWAYAGQLGRQVDAGAYYSGLGFVWDGIWLAWAIASWRVLTRKYFYSNVMVGDPFYRWAGATLSAGLLLAIYRAAFFYGACRWVAWTIWAHVVNNFKLDLTWGGPHWVHALYPADLQKASALARCPCPMCRTTQPTLFAYAIVVVCVRVKRLHASIVPATRLLLTRQE
ncbi:MAG TPA: metal-dependent hydrolase [Gaiellaceae bacterium]|nr:metal-dependent hydrolase [Gaiellaceae bacterium]